MMKVKFFLFFFFFFFLKKVKKIKERQEEEEKKRKEKKDTWKKSFGLLTWRVRVWPPLTNRQKYGNCRDGSVNRAVSAWAS